MLDTLAAEIAAMAAREAGRIGRPCRLAEVSIVRAVLEGASQPLSTSATARAAGVSEGVIRRWLRPGSTPPEACARLQQAVRDICNPAPVTLLLPPTAPTVGSQPAVVVAVPVKTPSLSVLLEWDAQQVRAARLREGDQVMASLLREGISLELRADGLSSVPVRYLPASTGRGQWERLFLGWCNRSGVGTPSECRMESEARAWFQARALPPGARLGPSEVVSALGVGGMGECIVPSTVN